MHFVNPLFLLALLAVAIPIMVHLFNFRRYKKIYFSNVEQLQQLQSETRRQSRLRELLILMCRILAIVFLVMAFAQPFIPRQHQRNAVGSNAVSVYIDNSFSMDNTNSEGSLIETAKRKAREIAHAYKPSDRFQLLTNTMSGNQFRWLSRDEFLSLVDMVEIVPASPLLHEVARRQSDFLHTSQCHNHEAYIISDFQSSATLWQQFPADTSVHTTLIPLESNNIGNIYIDSLALNAPVFQAGSTIEAQVWIVNNGNENVENIPVKLFLQGKERTLASVNIAAHERTTASLRFTLEDQGALGGWVETADYPITFDDKLYFSLSIAHKMRVLSIHNGTDNTYLRRLFSLDSLATYTAVSQHNIDWSTLSEQNLIIVNELPSIASALSQALTSFVDQGGSLLILPAPDAQPESYNALLHQLHTPTIGTLSKQNIACTEANTTSAHYLHVFEGSATNMELPTVQQHYRLQSSSHTLCETLLTLANGDALLTLSHHGQGKVFLSAAPMRPEYCSLVQQALFVPTFYNMMLYSKPIGEVYHTIGSHRPIALAGNYAIGDGRIRLFSADSTTDIIPDIRMQDNRYYLMPHNEIPHAGIFTITYRDQTMETLAFNYPRQESQMEFLSPNSIEQAVKEHSLTHTQVVTHPNKPLDKLIASQHHGAHLWRWCIALCLMALLAEILLITLPRRKEKK